MFKIMVGNDGGIPVDIKGSFYWPFGDRDLGKKTFTPVLNWDFNKMYISHGVSVFKGAKEFLLKEMKFLI